ncbi:AbrB/MazE/SpoVT family DNA-binding domain-containing protein [Lonepinella koalarum]|uniref:Antitoxin MazE n=1 Tax=Lonepinella koalarum TaxID=53417 RepID=A0A4R1KR08_9PAST|nr:AbrB/MazE/SpoVT family DNA-binding domain-containing protein [Lonepinella koalarum]TCK66927.1 antitoxin MazE [Lonepinella koalarum]TFJ88784.1 PbsX family transcriptional regulator [Lonepinella koalarum]
MQVTVQSLGNSLAIPIPNSLIQQFNMHAQSQVELRQEQGRIIIEPIRLYTLDTMLAQITHDNLHEEADFGTAQGNEAW